MCKSRASTQLVHLTRLIACIYTYYTFRMLKSSSRLTRSQNLTHCLCGSCDSSKRLSLAPDLLGMHSVGGVVESQHQFLWQAVR
jgi:hypothetical protein